MTAVPDSAVWPADSFATIPPNAAARLDSAISTRRAEHRTSLGARSIRIGLLGFGSVGQAFARLVCDSRDLLRSRGLEASLTTALVRNPRRDRGVAIPGLRLVTSTSAFLAERFDVVIEVLGGVEPAYGIVRQLLAGGTPVVTANKSLIAAHGEDLLRIAALSRTVLRCEASALAGVPLLNTLRDRPLAARVQHLCGIVNGTSNYVLTRIARDRATFDQAIAAAIHRGYAEPDPAFDLSGRDAAEKLIVLLQHLGIGGIRRENIECAGIERLVPDDLAQARVFSGVIKPVVAAAIDGGVVTAFVGPAWLPESNPLASIDDQQNGIRLRGDAIGELCFSGPGAGPDVTAGTLLDDVIDVQHRVRAGTYSPPQRHLLRTATSGWFLRFEYPAGRADLDAVAARLATENVPVRGIFGLRRDSEADRLYVLTRPFDTQAVSAAVRCVENDLNCRGMAIRALS